MVRRRLSRETAFLEVLKARVDGSLSNLVWWQVSCPWQETWNKLIFKVVSKLNHSMKNPYWCHPLLLICCNIKFSHLGRNNVSSHLMRSNSSAIVGKLYFNKQSASSFRPVRNGLPKFWMAVWVKMYENKMDWVKKRFWVKNIWSTHYVILEKRLDFNSLIQHPVKTIGIFWLIFEKA